jgi:hypothetical protein
MVASDIITSIRSKHGGRVYDGGRRWLGRGPGHGRRDMSLSLRVTASGRALLWSFAGDPLDECRDHLGLADAAADTKPDRETWVRERREREKEDREERRRKRSFCAGVWEQTEGAEASPVAAYLRQVRHLRLDVIPPVLRFHPAAPLAYPWSEAAKNRRTSPAMVAIVTGPDGQGSGLHVTPLQSDGARRGSKLMFGACIEGAVRLSPVGDEKHLGITEGIETALAFGQLHGLPTWATLSTSGLRRFRAPTGLRALTIGADSDDRGAGVDAAKAQAERASSRCDCFVMPAPEGQDWADVWEARQ